MIQLVPQLRILLACEPVDFRKGIDSLAALCRNQFDENPMSGSVFVFRNRAGTALKLLTYDGGGYWLCLRRISSGKIRWWPQAGKPLHPLQARELAVLLYNGLPDRADFGQDWKRIDPVVFNQAARASVSDSSPYRG
jgi:transposase